MAEMIRAARFSGSCILKTYKQCFVYRKKATMSFGFLVWEEKWLCDCMWLCHIDDLSNVHATLNCINRQFPCYHPSNSQCTVRFRKTSQRLSATSLSIFNFKYFTKPQIHENPKVYSYSTSNEPLIISKKVTKMCQTLGHGSHLMLVVAA